ncbi:hypothetical protein [Methanocella conradii]|uniref:hypothetical protein n=1 Tax=Methanocella conradii TaxID=1175444 RepID=UPI00064FA74A|nr:hypothetical protein [Methanocella conradii]
MWPLFSRRIEKFSACIVFTSLLYDTLRYSMLTCVLIMVSIVAGGHMVGAGVAVGVGVGEDTGVGSSTQPEAATAGKAKIHMASSLKFIFRPPCGWG